MPQSQIPPKSNEVYAVFCGLIDQNAVQKLFNGISVAMANNIQSIHLLFQSTGGYVGDGICLYNYFKALTCELTLYNVGSVQSIATIAYLGAKKRKTSARATFMIHRSIHSPQMASATRLKTITDSMLLDDQRIESILKGNITLTPEQWDSFNNNDLFFSGEDAIKNGLAHDVQEFAPPAGTQIYNF